MNEKLTPTEAREGENRRWQWRTFVVSTALIAVVLFAVLFIFLGTRGG